MSQPAAIGEPIRWPRLAARGLGVARGLRVALHGAVATLALFHAGLLWRRVADHSLLEPAVAMRWTGAALLLVALPLARRQGIPLFRGRRALVFWVLVVLLHVQLPAAPVAVGETEALLPLLPVVASVVAGLVLAVAPRRVRRGPTVGLSVRRRPGDPGPAGPRPAELSPLRFSRPPPALAFQR